MTIERYEGQQRNQTVPSDRLESLVAELIGACADFEVAAQMTLDAAVQIGGLLTEAKGLVPLGGWKKWCVENFPYSRTNVHYWMRLYHYREQIVGASSISEALRQLVGLPQVGRAGRPGPPSWMVDEVHRLRAEGKTHQAIADHLGIGIWRVTRILNQEAALKQTRRAQTRRRAAAAALREQERRSAIDQRARSEGGALAEAYSSLRQHCQALDRAISGTDDPATKGLLREAYNFSTKAEQALVRVLGVE